METTDLIIPGSNQYVIDRDNLISTIMNICHQVYPNDREMADILIDLTTELMIANPDREFIYGLRGFIVWASMTNQKASTVLTTIIHDLGEFSRNRHESWFSPRTSRYDKYLSGASGVIL